MPEFVVEVPVRICADEAGRRGGRGTAAGDNEEQGGAPLILQAAGRLKGDFATHAVAVDNARGVKPSPVFPGLEHGIAEALHAVVPRLPDPLLAARELNGIQVHGRAKRASPVAVNGRSAPGEGEAEHARPDPAAGLFLIMDEPIGPECHFSCSSRFQSRIR